MEEASDLYRPDYKTTKFIFHLSMGPRVSNLQRMELNAWASNTLVLDLNEETLQVLYKPLYSQKKNKKWL